MASREREKRRKATIEFGVEEQKDSFAVARGFHVALADVADVRRDDFELSVVEIGVEAFDLLLDGLNGPIDVRFNHQRNANPLRIA